MLEAVATVWAGQLVVEPAADVRHLSTFGACGVTDYVTGQPLEGQGDVMLTRWWWPSQPNARASAFVVEADGPVTVSLRQRFSHEYEGDWRYEFVSVHWAGPADFNVDGQADAFDFLAFQNAWDAGSMACDYDGDGRLSVFDWLAFMNSFGHHGGTSDE